MRVAVFDETQTIGTTRLETIGTIFLAAATAAEAPPIWQGPLLHTEGRVEVERWMLWNRLPQWLVRLHLVWVLRLMIELLHDFIRYPKYQTPTSYGYTVYNVMHMLTSATARNGTLPQSSQKWSRLRGSDPPRPGAGFCWACRGASYHISH